MFLVNCLSAHFLFLETSLCYLVDITLLLLQIHKVSMVNKNYGRSCGRRFMDDNAMKAEVYHTSLPRRPVSSISSVENSSTIKTEGTWERFSVSKGAWVLMQPRKRKRPQTKNIFLASWKGRVRDFKITKGKISVKEVLIQHVYMHKELVLRDYPKDLPQHRPNCIFFYCGFVLYEV